MRVYKDKTNEIVVSHQKNIKVNNSTIEKCIFLQIISGDIFQKKMEEKTL